MVDTVMSFIKSDTRSSTASKSYLGDVFRAALAHNNDDNTDHIKLVKAITKFIDLSHVHDALKSMLEEGYVESENNKTYKDYGNLIKATIDSLSPNLLTITLNSISSECLCQILHLFLEKNYVENSKEMIESKHILHSDNYGKAFVQAAKNNQIDVIELFISSKRFNALASDYLDQALETPNKEIHQMIKNSDRVKHLNITDFKKII